MTDRDECSVPYALFFALIGFLAGVLTLVLRSRRNLTMSATPSVAQDAPSRAIILPESMPTGTLPSPEDLTIIEGIGPKVQAVLRAGGIHSLKQLSRTQPAKLKALLVAAGNRISNPDTWPVQAALAAAGKMNELKTMHAGLKAGRKY
ncbi:MAG: hypothetical protein ACYC11_05705 [Bellilinea sp.]